MKYSLILAASGLLLSADALVVSPAGRPVVRFRAGVSSMVAEAPIITAETAKVSFDTSIDDIPKCPLTRWDSENIDFSTLTAPARTLPHKLAAAVANGDEEGYITANREAILAQLTESGAIWFQGFELMKSKEGFQRFYELLELSPCQDPLASVGARAVVSKKGAMCSSIYLYLSICLSMSVCLYRSIDRSIYLSIYLLIVLAISRCICIYLYLSVCISI